MNSTSINDLIINPKTKKFLKAYLNKPAHTLLLNGLKGVGLGAISKSLAYKIAKKNVIIIKPTLHKLQKTANINVSDIKVVQKSLNNKRKEPLIVIIDEVDKMTASTPETLLKTLEEPVDNVFFILTTHNMFNIPQTIVSRSQVIYCLPENCKEIINDIKPATKKQKIEFMAKDLPAETMRLIQDEMYFRDKARLFEEAKRFITSSTYQRLIIISKFDKRIEAIDFIKIINNITIITILKTGKTRKLSLLSEVLERLMQNGNIKAQLTYLAINY